MTYLLLFYEYFKTGLFAVGGGMATLPFLYDMSARHPDWFTTSQIADMLAVSESTPGPIGVNMATFVGFQVGGVLGAVVATIGLVAPSIIVILIIAAFLRSFRDSKIVQSVFYGLRPASAAMVAAAGLSVAAVALLNSGMTGLAALNWKAILLAAVLLVLLLVVALGGGSCSSANVPASTVERTALPAGSVNETGYFTDEDGDWIHDPAKLERGLRHFYEETGVQPYVYILPNGSVRSYQELQSIAQEKYDELFTDQAHFVLVFCDDGNGRFNAAYWAGAMTGSVLDDEAINIFKAYLSQNYDDMSLSEEEIFSDAFADTADRIMTVTPSPLPIIAVCAAVIIVAVVVFLIVRNRRLAKQREAERMQEILNTPLESLADAELADLEKKYAQAGASDAPPVQPTKPRP